MILNQGPGVFRPVGFHDSAFSGHVTLIFNDYPPVSKVVLGKYKGI